MTTPPGLTFPTSLAPLAVTPTTYLAANPTVTHLLVGTVVIRSIRSPSGEASPPRVLLVQRAVTDGFPLQWEWPGGGVDEDDLTIIDAARRELREETGLVMTRARALLDDAVEFEPGGPHGSARYRKITLLADVAASSDGGSDGNGDGEPVVTLDPAEHADYVWADEAEVRAGRCRGRDLVFAYDGARETVLAAFEVFKRI